MEPSGSEQHLDGGTGRSTATYARWPVRLCGCGCGEVVGPRRIYVDSAHRLRAWRAAHRQTCPSCGALVPRLDPVTGWCARCAREAGT